MNAPDIVHGLPPLQDPKLFRQQCYIDGGWCAADDGGTIAVTNPATGADARDRAQRMGAAETRRAIEAANAAWPAWRAKTAQRARGDPAQMVRADDGEPGGSRAADDGRAGQAAGRIARRDRLRGIVHRVVRRRRAGASTATRSRRTRPTSGSSCSRSRSACRVAITPWNFPDRDDHAQGRRRAGRRLHRWC